MVEFENLIDMKSRIVCRKSPRKSATASIQMHPSDDFPPPARLCVLSPTKALVRFLVSFLPSFCDDGRATATIDRALTVFFCEPNEEQQYFAAINRRGTCSSALKRCVRNVVFGEWS